MSSVRVPGSLRRPALKPVPTTSSNRPEVSRTGLFTAACLAAASPATIAIAQSTTQQDLPPLSVEAKQAKKKAGPTATQQGGGAVAAPTSTAAQPTPDQKGANPYADPAAPYKVDQSASGKLTEPLVNTPKTVTAVPKEVIEDQGVRDLRELARSVPGLTIGSAEGGNAYGAFAIRGFKANNDIFVDNIRNPGNLIPDAFFVEQVEIYKGPSGGIAGRNTIGGAVNIISKQPNLNQNFTEVTTTVGTDNTFRTVVDVNKVVTPNFAVRANVMYDQHDVAGRDVTESERWGGLISMTAKPSDALKITFDYLRYRNDAIPDWGVPVNTADHVPVTERGVPRDLWVGMKGLDFYKERADIVTATVVAKLADGVKLTNRSRAGQSEVDYVATSMEGYPDVHHPQRDQIANIYANQTELNLRFKTGGVHHNLVAGVELTRETIDRRSYTVSNWFDAQTPTASPPPPPCLPPARLFPGGIGNPCYTDVILSKSKVYDATIDTVGAYLTDTVQLSKQWIVNGGIRYDDFQRDQKGPVPANLVNDPNAKVQAGLFSWNVGVTYKPIPIASFYAAYATSQSPVGSELDSTGAQYNGLTVALVNAPPQEARSIEVGTKWELFNKHLLATAAVFHTDVDNARTNLGVTLTNDANAFTGKYRVQGIELGVAGNITKDWSVYGGLVVLDTEVLKSPDTSEVGRRLANIPLTQFSLLSRYQVTDRWAIAGAATYGGKVYGGHLAANDALNHTVDWWRFDAFTEYKLTDNVTVKLSGINLTNELYYDAIYQAGTGAVATPPSATDLGTFAFVAPGRAGYLTVNFKY
jgi:catecholate siderophore receptor